MSLKKNFASRLSIYVLLISAGLLLVVTALLGIFSRMAVVKESRAMAEKALDNTILEVELLITEVEHAVDNVDWMVAKNLDDENFLYEITRQLVVTNPNIVGSAVAFAPGVYKGREYFSPYAYIGDQTGELYSTQLGNDNYDYPVLDWFQIPKLLDRPYWSEPYFDEGGGQQRMSTYSIPLKDDDGNFFGIITADISLEWLSQKVASLKPYKNSYALLIGHNGSYIAHPDSSKVLNETVFTAALEMRDSTVFNIGKQMLSGERGTLMFDNDGVESFAVYGPLSNGWSMALVCDNNDVFKDARLVSHVYGLFILLGLVGMYLGCRKVVREQTMPIVEFSNSAMTIAKGNFNARIPDVKTKDELKRLRDSMAYMQQSINSYIVELKATTASNERYESELNIAREIQMSMLPTDFPQSDNCDIYAMVQPAKEVGGDLYDFIVAGDHLYFLVGDVSGKGVPASLFMAIARAAFRFIGALGLPMDEVLSRVNDCLCDGNDNNMFVTIFAGCINLATGRMEYCNAGHNPIVLVTPDGSASFLRAKPNLAAGLFPSFPYQKEETTLKPGTRLVLYTDGVTEAERSDKSQFGEEALLKWAESIDRAVSANASTLSLYSTVKGFTKGADQNDDITIMSIVYRNNDKTT